MSDLIRLTAADTAAAIASGEVSAVEVTQAHLDRIGYQGWIGCEYKPATTTEAGLGWRQRLAR